MKNLVSSFHFSLIIHIENFYYYLYVKNYKIVFLEGNDMKPKYILICSFLLINPILPTVKQDTGEIALPAVQQQVQPKALKSWNPFKTDERESLAALREVEETLVQIDKMNKEILQKRKQKDEEIRQHRTELHKKITMNEELLKKLKNEIETGFTNDIQDLKRRIASNEGNIKELEAAVKTEGALLSKAKTLNSWTLGYAQYAVDWAVSADAARRNDLNKQIKKLQDEITQWQKIIAENKEKMTKIFATEDFKKRQEHILQELNQAKNDLSKITSQIDSLEKEIIASYSNPAEALITKLKKLIKKADCSTIKTIADAKPAIIKACKERRLAAIKKAYPKSAACQRLTIDSSVEEIKKCK